MLSLSGTSPAPGENLVSLTAPIEFTIVDDGNGIDISTLIVEVRGFRVITGSVFADGFNITLTENDDDYIVVIESEDAFNLGKVYDVKIQVQDLVGNYFNTTYSFKTIPKEPILITSSPHNKEILSSSQILYLEFDDIIDGVDPNSISISINELDYIIDGVVQSAHNGLLTDITINDTEAVVRIDPIEALRNGSYILRYQVSDSLGNTLVDDLNFTVEVKPLVLPSLFSQTGFLGYYQGIERVSDIGQGDALFIEWNKPIKRIYKNEVFVLIYENQFRLNVFDKPKYLAIPEPRETTITGLTAGVTLSYGVRALELPENVLDPTGMTVVNTGVYLIPEDTTVAAMLGVSDLILFVESTDGFPDAGLLLVGRETIRYTSVDRSNHSFIIPANGRGLLDSSPGIYLPDDTVKLFVNCTDSNSVIVMATPTHQDGYNFDRFVNGEGVVVSDLSANDARFFQGFDFCGWHDAQPNLALSGVDDCGSYLGGEIDGFRGFDLFDRLLANEEVLLNTTGDPVILLKRIWDGFTCDCVDSRKVTPKIRSCPECFGTMYRGGYTQFCFNRRSDCRILVSFDESPEDLFYGEKEHLQQDYEPGAWTLPIPAIRDRDILVRFDFLNQIEFFYEVLNVSREVILNRRTGRQKLTLKRLDKTDITYSYPLDLSNLS